MDPTPSSTRTDDFNAGRLFLADSRLGLLVLNQLRYQALRRLGVSRAQANVVTAVLALSAADAAYEAVRRIARAPLGLSGSDATMAAFAVRAAGQGVAGPAARDIPGFGTLVAFALVGGFAVPGLRRTAYRIRTAEGRLRRRRISRYRAASRAPSHPSTPKPA
jgi:hypothetical protein